MSALLAAAAGLAPALPAVLAALDSAAGSAGNLVAAFLGGFTANVLGRHREIHAHARTCPARGEWLFTHGRSE